MLSEEELEDKLVLWYNLWQNFQESFNFGWKKLMLEPSCVVFDFVWTLTPTKTVLFFEFKLELFTHPLFAFSLKFRALCFLLF